MAAAARDVLGRTAQLPARSAATAHRHSGTSGRSPRPKASRDGGGYRLRSVLSSPWLRSYGFASCRRLDRSSVPSELGYTKARHEPAIGATSLTCLVGLRRSLVSSLTFGIRQSAL